MLYIPLSYVKVIYSNLKLITLLMFSVQFLFRDVFLLYLKTKAAFLILPSVMLIIRSALPKTTQASNNIEIWVWDYLFYVIISLQSSFKNQVQMMGKLQPPKQKAVLETWPLELWLTQPPVINHKGVPDMVMKRHFIKNKLQTSKTEKKG